MILLLTNFEKRNGAQKWFDDFFQDVNVLMDIVESVSPTIPDNWDDYEEESEVKILWNIIKFDCVFIFRTNYFSETFFFFQDEDEKMARRKQEIKDKTMGVINILCVWDCANIWLKISEVLSIIVFDPFTG